MLFGTYIYGTYEDASWVLICQIFKKCSSQTQTYKFIKKNKGTRYKERKLYSFHILPF